MGELKNVKAKVKFKHELEKDWLRSLYVPGESELVVYDVETDNDLPEGRDTPYKYPRFKVGDGTTNVNDLPFAAQAQADWKQTDETAPDYIKNKLGLELGEAPKTTQQPGSLAISEGATAFGDHTFAGLKAFEVIGWDDANNTYTLKTPLPEDISTGTSYSSQIKNNYYKCGEITSISTDRLVIGVTNYKSPTGVAINEYHYIWFTDYPTCGDLDIGKNATAIGKDNFAIQDNAVSIGRENRSIGKNAVTLGRNNEAYYSAFAVGHSNKALNAEAIAMGALNEATGACSVAIGYNSKSEGQDSFAGGRNTKAVGKAAFAYGNTATAEAPNSVAFGQNSKATSEGQFVIGDNTIDNNATMIVAKNNQNIFTVNNDGTASVSSEPQKHNDVATKGFVETHTNSFNTRIEALESGYLLFEQNSNIIEFDSTSEGYALIKRIGGNSVEGVNKVNPQKLYSDEKNSKSTFKVNDNGTITIHYNKKGGDICLVYKLQVKANTPYRIKFDINGTNEADLNRTLKYIYVKSDPNDLWNSTTLKTLGISSNFVDVTYTPDSDREVAFCLYRPNVSTTLSYPSEYDEYISNLMITEGTDQDSYVPYMMVPTKVTQITSYDSDGNSIDTYSTPSSILDLPAFGHGIGNSYNAIDFADKIYTQVTNDGISIFNNAIITDVSDKVDEMPKLKVASNGKLQVTTSTGANVNLFIFYKKDADAIDIATISLDDIDDICTTGGLFRNGISAMSWYDLLADGYINVSNNKLNGTHKLNNIEPFELVVDNSITIIGVNAFYSCDSLISIVLPDTVTHIYDSAFSSCDNLMSINMPNSLEVIGEAFSWCTSLTSIAIPDNVTTIFPRAFHNCTSLTSLKIGASITHLPDAVFMACSSLTNVVIPENVASINTRAFQGCTSLKSVLIRNSVTRIGYNAFEGCNALTDIYVPWSEGAVSGAPWGATNATIHYNSEV